MAMDRLSLRNILKQVLRMTRVKIIYARITLTKYTILFFLLSLVNCLVLVALQGLAFADNSEGVRIVEEFLATGNITEGVVILTDNSFKDCDDIPIRGDDTCVTLVGTLNLTRRDTEDRVVYQRGLDIHPVTSASGQIVGVSWDGEVLSQPCLQSFIWLADILYDARREDVVTLVFQFWLFSLVFVAILNESLPHLGASLFGHILGTAWVGYRISNSLKLEKEYQTFIVQGTCSNIDILGGWWDVRMQHTIPSIAINCLALVLSSYFSFKLFKVYANESFSRVGTSERVNHVYKLVLLLSVTLQLAGFFVLASTGMWLDKIANNMFRQVVLHLALYRAAFIVMAALVVPWLVLGWRSVRREHRIQFAAFIVLSVLLVVISSLMFASPLFLYIFGIWPFFATMTVTSYIILVASSAMAVVCRLNFGKGLAQYLLTADALEGIDFTPVVFPLDAGTLRSLDEKYSIKEYSHLSRSNSAATLVAELLPYAKTLDRQRVSVYSDPTRATVKLSTTPSLAQDGLLSQVPMNIITENPVTSRTSSMKNKAETPAAVLRALSPQSFGFSGIPNLPQPSRVMKHFRRGVGLPSNPRSRSDTVNREGSF